MEKMAVPLLAKLVKNNVQLQCTRHMSAVMVAPRPKHGNREIVGHGWNGEPEYLDRWDFPFPAVRFKACDNNFATVLKEKEKGDWKKLSIDEKKELYRISFCQTYAEFNSPKTGRWKSTVGSVCILLSISLCYFTFLKYMTSPGLPITFSKEYQQAQLERMIVIKMNPITGIASHYPDD
ncbi:cytochrome c oxidase subunit 4 isoform 1, mitochondrial-like [Prorops nasuta]|uniref:cytochrome c oxidase subunit 4 isoform 1, mitochondrial-like n=1 Tax=Prorops nasuta TaxID=863751 RepID=UPI0034CFB8DC